MQKVISVIIIRNPNSRFSSRRSNSSFYCTTRFSNHVIKLSKLSEIAIHRGIMTIFLITISRSLVDHQFKMYRTFLLRSERAVLNVLRPCSAFHVDDLISYENSLIFRISSCIFFLYLTNTNSFICIASYCLF